MSRDQNQPNELPVALGACNAERRFLLCQTISVRALTLIAAIFSQAVTANFNVDVQSFLQMPAHCKAKLAAMGDVNNNWGFKVPDSRPYEIDRYKQRMGRAWDHMHHYCAGLAEYVKLKDQWKFVENKDSNRIRLVSKQFQYQLDKTKWSPGLTWFKAEVLKNYARALQLFGEMERAEYNYKAAISADASYLPAYWDLAGFYEVNGAIDLAVKTLKDGLSRAKKRKYKKSFEDRITSLESAEAATLESEAGGPEISEVVKD